MRFHHEFDQNVFCFGSSSFTTYLLLHMSADNFPSSILDILPYLQGHNVFCYTFRLKVCHIIELIYDFKGFC